MALSTTSLPISSTEHALFSEDLYSRIQVFDALPYGVIVTDHSLRIVDINQTAYEHLGLLDPMLAAPLRCAIPDQRLLERLCQPESRSEEWLHRDRWLCIEASLLPGVQSGYLVVMRDMSEQKEREEHLQHLATKDYLTGVWNRRYFTERFAEELERVKRYGQPLGLLMCDLDRFKRVNDTYGHAVGDLALQHVTKLITTMLRPMDGVGRLGGEEFAILLPNTDRTGAIHTADRLRRHLESNPLDHDCDQIHLTMSLGVTVSDNGVLSAGDMLKLADDALYSAKAKGRNRTEYRLSQENNSMDHEMASKILVLASTGLEALEYVYRHLEGKPKQTIMIFADVVEAFWHIERVLAESGILNELNTSTQSLKESLHGMVKGYEDKELRPEDLQLTLLPRYKEWKDELQVCFGQYMD